MFSIISSQFKMNIRIGNGTYYNILYLYQIDPSKKNSGIFDKLTPSEKNIIGL